MVRIKKPTFVHSYLVAKLIKMSKGNVVAPNDFKINVAKIFHIEKEYSIIVLKELMEYGLVKSYSSKEIVFNDTNDTLGVFIGE